MEENDLRNYFERYIRDNPIKEEKPINFHDFGKVMKRDYKLNRISRIRRNETCYFCAFDKIIHKHHIIRKVDGGDSSQRNILTLCPNCHALTHSKIYKLKFWDGYLFLFSIHNQSDIIFPSKLQHGYTKSNPNVPLDERIAYLKKKGAIKNL